MKKIGGKSNISWNNSANSRFSFYNAVHVLIFSLIAVYVSIKIFEGFFDKFYDEIFFADEEFSYASIYFYSLLLIGAFLLITSLINKYLAKVDKKIVILIRIIIGLVMAYILYKYIAHIIETEDIDYVKNGCLYLLSEQEYYIKKVLGIVIGHYTEDVNDGWLFVNLFFKSFISICFVLSLVFNSIGLFLLMPLALLLAVLGLTESSSLLCYCGLLLLVILLVGKNRSFKKNIKDDRRAIACDLSVIAGFIALAFCVNTLFTGTASRMVDNADKVYDFQKRIEETLKNGTCSLFGSIGTAGYNTSPHLTNKSPDYKNTLVFTVQSNTVPVTNLYFKDFHSAKYYDNTWEYTDYTFDWVDGEGKDVDPNECRRLIANGLFYNWYENTAAITFDVSYKHKMENVPIPYFISDNSLEDLKVKNDNLYETKNSDLTIKTLPRNVFVTIDKSALYGLKNDSDCWDKMSYSVIDRYIYSPNVHDAQAEVIADYLLESDHYIDEIRYSEYDFNELDSYGLSYMFLNDNYFYSIGYDNYFKAIGVAGYLSKHFTYSLDLDDIDDSVDPVSYFLNVSHEGYCAHFASAAVQILREMRVPVRYASGYVVKRDLFKSLGKGEGYQAEVRDTCAHAWIEVYVDRIGWMPVEVTPGYYTNTESGAPNRDPNGNINNTPTPAATNSPTPQATNSPTPATTNTPNPTKNATNTPKATNSPNVTKAPTDKTSSSGGFGPGSGKGIKIPKQLIIGAIVSGLIIGIIFLIKKHNDNIIRQMVDDFNKKRYRIFILKVNKKIYKKLKYPNLLAKSNLTDSEYVRLLSEQYPNIGEDKWNNYYKAISKAAFSKDQLTKDEARFCMKIFVKVKKYKK